MARSDSFRKKTLPAFEIVMDTNTVLRGELYPAAAPNTVGNFIRLANNGFYDGLTFHRCIRNFIIQGGKASQEPNFCIRGEFEFNGDKHNRLPHQYGSLCMARSNHYDSASTQFFIVVTREAGELRCLDGAYAVFGQITEGMKTAEAIAQLKTDEAFSPLQPQMIRRVRVETFGEVYPVDTIAPPVDQVNQPTVRHRGQKNRTADHEKEGLIP